MEPSDKVRTVQIGVGWFPEQPGNGLDRVFHALARHLPTEDVDVRGLVVGSDNVARATRGQVQAFAPASAPLPQRLLGIRAALKRPGFLAESDLAAVHFALFAFPALDLLGALPLVVHFHGPWAMESRAEQERSWLVAVKAAIERRVYRRADRFIVLSDAFREVLAQSYGVPRERIRIVPGGVDTERFDTGHTVESARERLGWPADRPTLLSVRRLVRRVGLEALVRSMERVRRHVPDALLMIAGKGPLAQTLHDLIRERGLEHHVRLLGFVPDDDLPVAYRAADLSVVPTSSLEGFGLIAAESLAAGTPVMVTPVGGLPEVVRDLDAHLVFEGHDVESIARGLTRALLGEFPLPDAAECRRFAVARYAWPAVARSVRAVYEEVL